ncbi:MFS transporter [Mucilaginibacter auburnensis]|uniref:Putative MFS family arabinose efflux permease n=1 Tax=Mucilaginibacter auburnensis TaxID=1457233 RepID=A0A2H9VRC4_9SPHI|nr:MFS transporter [Mucilaginibacter auburnensis]PJJ83386.1 putative MFS family arabinose efflux permease [Mucilaginibacter auburnensis]
MTNSPERPSTLTPFTLWVMTITTGLVIANIYYNQPLLDDIAKTFGVTSAKAGQVAMLTQIGYALGIFLVVPMADMLNRKRMMIIDFGFMVIALLLTAIAPNINALIIASFFIGVSSIIPQFMLPMAAHLAQAHERGKTIGFVQTGLLIGILLSRTLSGFIAAHYGWRSVFYIAAALMLVMWGLVYRLLPEVQPTYKGTYKSLMLSITGLIKDNRHLRLAALRGASCFACFSAFWSTIAFLVKQNFNMGSDVAGLFGLAGAFGALAVSRVGRLTDKVNPYKLATYTIAILLLSFVVYYFSGYSLVGMVVGVILMDMGLQATHLCNQAIIFANNAAARNRINTVYMVSYFGGGAIGTFFGTQLWYRYQWTGVCILGIAVSALTLILHLNNQETLQPDSTTV